MSIKQYAFLFIISLIICFGCETSDNSDENSTDGWAPAHLSAVALSESSIKLTWDDNSEDELGFYIEVSQNNMNSFSHLESINANIETYTHTGLQSNTRYYYRICAYKNDGVSEYSNISDASTFAQQNTIPLSPSSLNATTLSSSSIRLTWADNSSNETGFKIERSLSSGTGFTEIAAVSANTSTYDSTGLNSATRYYYRVRAYNSAGNSSYCSETSALTSSVVTIPNAPNSLSATTLSSSSIRLTWTDNSSNETGFRIERSLSSGTGFTEIAAVSSNTSTYDSTGLNSATRYYYRVRAYNSAGNSSYCSEASALTNSVITLPNTPSNLIVDALSPSSIRIQWTDNSSNETGFRIERQNPSNTSLWVLVSDVSSNTITYTHSGIDDQTFCGYRIRAYNSAGNSSWTTTAFAPKKVRIINDLYDSTSINNIDWYQLNKIVRIRIGVNLNNIINDTTNTYEKLCPVDTATTSYFTNSVDYINPAYNVSTKYRDFDTSSFGSTYYIFVQCGWWEYDAVFSYSWIKRVTQVTCQAGTCYKWATWTVSSHNAGYEVIKVSSGLPHWCWDGYL